MTSRIVVCDDERGVRFALCEVLVARGYEVVEAPDAARALAALDGADVLVTDLVMPGIDGFGLLAEARARDPELPVVLLTARGSERIAVQAMKAGAYDYLPKPFDVDELALAVARAAEAVTLRRGARRAAVERATGQALVGEAPAMRALLARIERLAKRDVPVLIGGETGTGKELVATLLHALGPRAGGALVRFNCAAIPAELAEAELFGHARGAFTGAVGARSGLFARAHRGTLLLDEVGELPLAVQPKLLRALQEGEIQPLGASRSERVDVRLCAATHRDLRAEVEAGRFREDLFFRLAVVELEVPPLAARRADIPALCAVFAGRYAARFGMPSARLAPALVAALAARAWPGNVRELENAVARMLALCDESEAEIGVAALAALDGTTRAPAPAARAPAEGEAEMPFRARVEHYERGLVSEALAAAGGNRSEAARRLGLSRVTLLDRMKRLGLG